MGVQRRRSAAAGETQGLDAVAALRHGRRVARLSQRDLARRAGVSQSLIARIEARRVDPPVGVMQRLLGCCGLRWELRLVVVGDTAVAVRRRRAAVTGSALRRSSAATDRRCAPNAAARDSARRSAGLPFTVRARRQLAREVRVAERAAQAIAYAELICVEDDLSRRAAVADGRQADRRLRRYLQHFRVPTADRLPARVGPARSADLTALLEALSAQWPWPPVALSGWAAAAVWSPGRHLPPSGRVELAAMSGDADARRFLAAVGARPRVATNDVFDLGRLAIRLRPEPPLSTSLVRWQVTRPGRALAVERPETRPGPAPDRHTVRAVLQSGRRDRRGRRRAPYQEALETAIQPVWLGPNAARATASD